MPPGDHAATVSRHRGGWAGVHWTPREEPSAKALAINQPMSTGWRKISGCRSAVITELALTYPMDPRNVECAGSLAGTGRWQ